MCLLYVLTIPHLFLQIDARNDGRDFVQVRQLMRDVGYSQEEVETVWKLLAAILQLVSRYTSVSYFIDHYLIFVWNR